MLAPNSILGNRYRIVRVIGRGRSGLTYEATNEFLGMRVAIREGHAISNLSTAVFKSEAQIQSSLYHPALPKILDCFDEDEKQYLVMTFIPGRSLGELLQERGTPFPQDDVLNWTNQLLDLLAYLHSQEPPIILRNISPENLKLGGRNTIGIVDYVLAQRREGLAPTQSDRPMAHGTLTFFAPEELLDKEIDQRTDLYSLAATMYYLLTGSLPPDFLTRAAASARGETDPVLKIDQSNPLAKSKFAKVLLRAMAFDPLNRPASAGEMMDQLLEVEEVTTIPLPPSESPVPTKIPGADAIRVAETVINPPPLSPQNDYEVFISYRRQNGSSEARLIRAELMHQQNVKAFLDVDDLGAGHFDEALLKRIAEIPNFIVILSSSCLERCADERDWLRREIVQALATNRKIIPVLLPGFDFPDAEKLPGELRSLSSHQSVFYSHEYFDAMIAKIVRYFRQT